MRIYILDIKECGVNSIYVYGKREDGFNVYICVDNFPRFCYALDNSAFQPSLGSVVLGEQQPDVLSEEFLEVVNLSLMPYYEVKRVVRHPIKVAFDRENVVGLDDEDTIKRGLLITYIKTDDHDHSQDSSFSSLYSKSAISIKYGLSSIFGNVDQLKQAFMLAIGFTGPGWYNVDHGQLRDRYMVTVNDNRSIERGRGECFTMNHPREFDEWKQRITPIPNERADFSKHPPLDVAFCYMQSARPKGSDGKVVASLSVKLVTKVTDLSDLNNDTQCLKHIIINGDLLSQKQKDNHVKRTMCSFVNSSTKNFAADVSELFKKINPDVIVCHGSLFETGECEASWFDVFQQHAGSVHLLSPLNKAALRNECTYLGFSDSCRRYAKRLPSSRPVDSDVRNLFSGVICCDTATACKTNVPYRSYYLDSILMDPSQREIVTSLSKRYSGDESLTRALRTFHRFSFANSHINDTISHIIVALDAIGYVEQITNALYLALSNSFMTKSTWNEALTFTTRTLSQRLYSYEFHHRGYALPTRRQFNHSKYQGGKVISPPTGLIKTKTVWYDFVSHYPSIILEFNICHTTTLGGRRSDLKRPIGALIEDMRKREGNTADGKQTLGVIPELVSKLISLKNEVKSKLQSCPSVKEKGRLTVLYHSCKVIINALYGALGDKDNLFYENSLASLITRLGREALDIAIDTFNEYAAEHEDRGKVFYVDTDSTGLDTKSREEPRQLLQRYDVVKEKINSRFRHMKLEADGVFSRMLFTNKKRYIGYKWDPGHNVYKLEVKGLEMIKRDWPAFLSKCVEEFAPILLTDADGPVNFGEIGAVIDKWIKGLMNDPTTLGLDIRDFIVTNRIDKRNKQRLGEKGLEEIGESATSEERNNAQPPHTILANRTRKTHDIRYKNDTVVNYVYVNNTPFVRKLLEDVELSEKYDSLPLDVNEIYYQSYEIFKVPVGDIVDKALYVKKFFLRPIASMFKSWENETEDTQGLENLVRMIEGFASPTTSIDSTQSSTRLEQVSALASASLVGRLVDSYAGIYGNNDHLKRAAEAKRPVLMCQHCKSVFPMQGIFKSHEVPLQFIDDISCAFTCPSCTRDLNPENVVGSMALYASTLISIIREAHTQSKLASMVIKRMCAESLSDLKVALDYELYQKIKKKQKGSPGSVTVISCSENVTRDKIYIFDQCRSQMVNFGEDNANSFIRVLGGVLSNWNK